MADDITKPQYPVFDKGPSYSDYVQNANLLAPDELARRNQEYQRDRAVYDAQYKEIFQRYQDQLTNYNQAQDAIAKKQQLDQQISQATGGKVTSQDQLRQTLVDEQRAKQQAIQQQLSQAKNNGYQSIYQAPQNQSIYSNPLINPDTGIIYGVESAATPGEILGLNRESAFKKIVGNQNFYSFAQIENNANQGVSQSIYGQGYKKVVDAYNQFIASYPQKLFDSTNSKAQIAGQVLSGATDYGKIALIDYPSYLPQYSLTKFGAETVLSGGKNVYDLVYNILSDLNDPRRRYRTLSTLGLGYVQPEKSLVSFGNPEEATGGYNPKAVPQRYRQEYIDYHTVAKGLQGYNVEVDNIDFRKVESIKNNQAAQSAIRDAIKRADKNISPVIVGGTNAIELGAKGLRRINDIDLYSDNIPQTIDAIKRELDKKGISYSNPIDKKGNIQENALEINGKKAVEVNSIRDVLKPTIATVSNKPFQNNIKITPEGIKVIDPILPLQRKYIGGFEPGGKTGEALARYSKDIPAYITAAQNILRERLKEIENYPPAIKQYYQLKIGRALDYLEPYKYLAEQIKAQPVPERYIWKITSQDLTRKRINPEKWAVIERAGLTPEVLMQRLGVNPTQFGSIPEPLKYEIAKYMIKQGAYLGGSTAVRLQLPEGAFRQTRDLDIYVPANLAKNIPQYAKSIVEIGEKFRGKGNLDIIQKEKHLGITDLTTGEELVDLGSRGLARDKVVKFGEFNVRKLNQIAADKREIIKNVDPSEAKYQKAKLDLELIDKAQEAIKKKTKEAVVEINTRPNWFKAGWKYVTWSSELGQRLNVMTDPVTAIALQLSTYDYAAIKDFIDKGGYLSYDQLRGFLARYPEGYPSRYALDYIKYLPTKKYGDYNNAYPRLDPSYRKILAPGEYPRPQNPYNAPRINNTNYPKPKTPGYPGFTRTAGYPTPPYNPNYTPPNEPPGFPGPGKNPREEKKDFSLPNSDEKQNQEDRRKNVGYIIIAKRDGEFRRIPGLPLKKSDARDAMASLLDNDLARTGRLIPVKTQRLGIIAPWQKGYFERFRKNLREYSIRNGRKIMTPDQFIEEAKSGLSSKEEIRQIQEARRNALVSKGRFTKEKLRPNSNNVSFVTKDGRVVNFQKRRGFARK